MSDCTLQVPLSDWQSVRCNFAKQPTRRDLRVLIDMLGVMMDHTEDYRDPQGEDDPEEDEESSPPDIEPPNQRRCLKVTAEQLAGETVNERRGGRPLPNTWQTLPIEIRAKVKRRFIDIIYAGHKPRKAWKGLVQDFPGIPLPSFYTVSKWAKSLESDPPTPEQPSTRSEQMISMLQIAHITGESEERLWKRAGEEGWAMDDQGYPFKHSRWLFVVEKLPRDIGKEIKEHFNKKAKAK